MHAKEESICPDRSGPAFESHLDPPAPLDDVRQLVVRRARHLGELLRLLAHRWRVRLLAHRRLDRALGPHDAILQDGRVVTITESRGDY